MPHSFLEENTVFLIIMAVAHINVQMIGEEVTEILEHKSGELYVRQIIRHKYAVKQASQEQEEPTVQIAAHPPLPRSKAGASLLAELLINKYQHHLPFHRQISMLRQIGFSLSASTISGWFQGTCDLLRTLYQRLQELVKECDYIQVDERTVPVTKLMTTSISRSHNLSSGWALQHAEVGFQTNE